MRAICARQQQRRVSAAVRSAPRRGPCWLRSATCHRLQSEPSLTFDRASATPPEAPPDGDPVRRQWHHRMQRRQHATKPADHRDSDTSNRGYMNRVPVRAGSHAAAPKAINGSVVAAFTLRRAVMVRPPAAQKRARAHEGCGWRGWNPFGATLRTVPRGARFRLACHLTGFVPRDDTRSSEWKSIPQK